MTTTFLPMLRSSLVLTGPGSGDAGSAAAVQHAGELAQIEREPGCRSRAAECLADAVVAAAVANVVGLARGEDGKDRAVLVMIAAQIREVDMQRLDALLHGLRE